MPQTLQPPVPAGLHNPDLKQRVAALYTRVAPQYEAHGPPFFAHAGRRLVKVAGVAEGDVVLDVAAGRGAVLLAAAVRVGRDGRVIGIDLAEGMVEQTGAAIARYGLWNAEMRLMDAERLAFAAATFGHVIASKPSGE